MKTIVIATDFSDIAMNATRYGAEIAKNGKMKIVLFHAYHMPVSTADVPEVIPSLDLIEKYALEKIEEIRKTLISTFSENLEIECVCKCGFAVDEINNYCLDEKIDLIVIGMHGMGYISEKLIGNVTSALIRKAVCPVLVIDQNVRFDTPEKIVLACDYKDTENKTVLDPLKKLVQLFDSHVYVLNVVTDLTTEPKTEMVSDFMKIEHLLKNISHSFHHVENDDVVEGINQFVSNEKTDMVVMIPRKHSFIQRFFHEPNTKKMAFHSQVPLLALH